MIRNYQTAIPSVEGHTDDVGRPAANKTLSDNRARSVMNALMAQGIAAARLSAVGYGQERPIADNRGEEGQAKNRRVELINKQMPKKHEAQLRLSAPCLCRASWEGPGRSRRAG